MDSPQIIELGNTIGCLFTIENKYPESWTILDNFVRTSMGNIWGHETVLKQNKNLVSEKVNGVNKAVFQRDEFRAKVFDNYQKKLSEKIKLNKTLDFMDNFKADVGKFYHSGLATKNSKQDKIMENNAIIKVRI